MARTERLAVRLVSLACLALAAVTGLPATATAAPSHLDLGFNAPAGYSVFSGWGSAEGIFHGAVDQPDGKHVLVGVSGRDLLVARYHANWSPDASFGGGRGLALYTSGTANIEQGYAVAVLPDGSIVAGGTHYDGASLVTRPLVVRFTAAGALDASFGDGGGAVVLAVDSGEVRALLAQPDGKILVGVNMSYAQQTVLARLNAEGSYDTAFGGGDGLVVVAGSCFGLVPLADGKFVRAGSTVDAYHTSWVSLRRFTRTGEDDGLFGGTFMGEVRAATALPGGGVAVSGYRYLSGPSDVFAARYTAAGAPDTGFGGTGQVALEGAVGRTENGYAIAPGPGGRILVGGYAQQDETDPLLVVLLADGLPDPDVGGGSGKVVLGGSAANRAYAVIPEEDGAGIVLAGWADGPGGADAALWRFSAVGVPDADFGGGTGALTIDGGGMADDQGVRVAVAPDGGIVVAATSGHEGGTANIVVLRYTAAGALDTAFGGGDGIFVYDGGDQDQAGGLALLPDGGIAVSGWRSTMVGGYPADDALVLKLTATGALDTTFSEDGIFTWDGGSYDYGSGLAATPDGGLVVCGITYAGSGSALVLKLTADGALDPSFSGDGVFTGGGAAYAKAVVVRPTDGEIFVLGTAGSSPTQLYLFKLTAAGAPNGGANRNFGDNYQPGAVALQADGKVLAVGTVNGSPRVDAVVTRFTAGLALDTAFGGVGTGSFVFAGNPRAEGRDVLPLSDGRILVAGRHGNALVMRFTEDGALDSSFDGDGWTVLALSPVDAANGIAVDASGRYVVAGTVGEGMGYPDVFVARINAAGVPLYELAVGTDGNGTGTVSSLPWIACGSDCSESYPAGTQVTLTPQAGPGSTFAGWAGDCTGQGGCTVTMDAARGVTATFLSLTQNTLAVSKAGTGAGLVTSDLGGIDCGAACAADYLLGSAVTLTPAADPGSRFVSWSGCDLVDGTRCKVALNGDRAVEARFDVRTFTLTVVRTGSGTVAPGVGSLVWDGDSGSGTHAWNTTVALTPSPAEGWVFSHWTGGCAGSGGCTVSMTADRTVGAVFTITRRRLTVDTTGAGAGTVTPSVGALDWSGATGTADYDYGTAVSLHAEADAGYVFTGWGGDCAGAGTGDCDLALTADRAAGAAFAVFRPRLTVTVSGAGDVSADSGTLVFDGATGTADYDYGTPVTLHAAEAAGYAFAGWSGACSGLGDCALTMSANRAVGARFNRPPVLEPVGDRLGAEGSGLVIQLVGSDPDGDALAYTLVAGPAGATLDPDTGVFSWTPWWDAAGDYPGVRVEVTDGAAAAGREFAISVADFVNPPRLDERFPGVGADPDWLLSPSGGWTVDAGHRYASKPTVNALARAKAVSKARPFTAGRVRSLVRLSTPFAQYANAALVFAWNSSSAYRFVRLRAGSLQIGQVGVVGGAQPGIWTAARPIAIDKPYRVQVDVWPSGLVQVKLTAGSVSLKPFSHKFGAAAAGQVGLLTLRARSFVDDVIVQDESALYRQ